MTWLLAALAALSARILAIRSAGVVLSACAAWLLATAGMRPLMLPDEGRYAGIAWEMLGSGNWLVPTLDGMPFFHKPPLFYWITMLGLQLFGANEWAARIASTGAAILAVAALYAFVRKYADRPTANLAAVILVTQPFFFFGAQFANLDMLVASMISIAILAGADAVLRLESGQPYRASLTAAHVSAALGVLAKGLIGFVLPGAILLAWLLFRRKYRLIPALLPLRLILLFFGLTAPWFLWMEKSFSGFWDYFFVYHHFRRFTEVGFNNQQPIWFYFPVLLLLTLPWSLWIVRGLARRVPASTDKFAVRSLLILWTLGILVFFSLPKSKLIGYILPALPAFAALIAIVAMQWSGRGRNAAAWIGLCVAGAAAFCLAAVIGLARHDSSGLRFFAARTGQQFSANDQIVMIDAYQYDMPFYLRAARHPWVIGDWTDPGIAKVDDWRKELFDAGRFAPAAMRENLISAGEFSARLCAFPDVTFWIWGDRDAAARHAFLDEKAIVFSHGKKSAWRIDRQARRQFRLCDGTPSNG
jgi:4-amino-4-deoxy-L-arabinose transferase-like glycosyltransferase